MPWNYPVEVTLNKIGPILATGNTTVLKPAPDTPLNATRLGRLVAERTDIPAGVFNVVTSSDHLVGEELTLSPMVDMISFTGSTAVGKRIMEKGAATLKRVFLELGGKSAMIVLDDADFASVVPAGAMVCVHAGQGCAMQTRMLLPRARYDEGVELITDAMSAMTYGDPNDDSVLMGPLVSEKQRDRVLGYIATGQQEGAKLVVGGGRPSHLPKGWFVEPTLFVDVDNSMTIAQEEIFGPVLGVIPYDDDDDAVRIANDCGYGLSGGVFSASDDRATAIARQHPHRVDQRQRRPVVRRRLALRRLQDQRHRASERHRGLRAIPRDQGHRLARRLGWGRLMGLTVKAGSRIRSVTCATEVVVVKGAGELDLRCGGEPMVELGAEAGEGSPRSPFDGGTLMGKRYVDGGGSIELLCTKPGAGSLSLGDEPLSLKEAKPLPASD